MPNISLSNFNNLQIQIGEIAATPPAYANLGAEEGVSWVTPKR